MDPPYETLSAIRPHGGGRHRTAARTNARIRLSAGRTPTRHGTGGAFLILPEICEQTSDGEGGRPDRMLNAAVIQAPNDATGTEVGGHGEGHGSLSVAWIV